MARNGDPPEYMRQMLVSVIGRERGCFLPITISGYSFFAIFLKLSNWLVEGMSVSAQSRKSLTQFKWQSNSRCS